MATKTVKKTEKQICIKCKKDQVTSNYYNTSDTDFFPIGKIATCKACCNKVIEETGFDGFQVILRMINKPLLQELFKGEFQDYIRIVNSMPQYKVLTYNDSTMFNESKSIESMRITKPKELTEDEIRSSEDFWGVGYDEQEYIYLNMEYQDYQNRYEVDTKVFEQLIKEICLTSLDIRNKRSKKADVKAELKSLQELLGSSNLKPMQETGAQSIDQETYGTLIKKFEYDRPIPEPDERWKDVDNIGKYIRIFFLGHMARMFGKEDENPYKEEYDDEIAEYSVSSEVDEEEDY